MEMFILSTISTVLSILIVVGLYSLLEDWLNKKFFKSNQIDKEREEAHN